LAIDDEVEGEQTEDAETDTVEDTTETEEVTEEPEVLTLDDLEVKYLHESKKLKDFERSELQALVQKGMNHDRLLEKLQATDAIKGQLSEFGEIAELYGYDTNTLRELLLEQYYANKAEQEGLTPEIVKREHQLSRKEKQLNSKTDEQKQGDAFAKFVSQYPDVKQSDITPETWSKFHSGTDLTLAYEQQLKDAKIATMQSEIEQLKNQLKVTAQNSTNKKKAVVKPTTHNGSDKVSSEDDDIMRVFLED
jgi:hypothetical protein